MPRTKALPLLHAAVSRGTITEVEALLQAGEDLGQRDADGRTALHWACIGGRIDFVDLLLGGGADPNAVDKRGWTALHFSAQLADVGVSARLLAAGATVDAPDADGNTPLFRAVFTSHGQGEMIALLLTHGADATKANNHGTSPLTLSHRIANYNVRQWLPPK